MRDQHRFGALQMRVSGHGRFTGAPGLGEQRRDQLFQVCGRGTARLAHEQPQIGRDLLVAAAPGVQLEAGFADRLGQLLLDEMMHVFGIGFLAAAALRRWLAM